MKNAINTILSTAIAAAVLTLSAGAASAQTTPTATGTATLTEGKIVTKQVFTTTDFGRGFSVNAGAREVQFNNYSYLAFCIEPTVTLSSGTTYTASSYSVSQAVQNLYSSSFTSTWNAYAASKFTDATSFASFQLALWELQNDDGNLSTGSLSFSTSLYNSQATVSGANALLAKAKAYTGAALYNFTKLDGATSQDLLLASRVPEADTWAMMVAGLGLVGFMARRRKAA